MDKTTPKMHLDENVWKALLEIGDDDGREFLNGLIDLFLKTAPPVVSELKVAIDKSDAESTRQLAHRLRGYSANLGAWELNGICAELEQSAKLGAMSGARALFTNLEKEFDVVNAVLHTERNRSK